MARPPANNVVLRQVSLSMPERLYQSLRTLAVGAKVSRSELVRQLIAREATRVELVAHYTR